MDLKQKFEKILKNAKPHFLKFDTDDCVNVTEKFAVDFAEWLVIIYNEDIIYSDYNTKELLEIFKKSYQNELQLFLITPKLSNKKYYLSMGKLVKYTKVKVIKITEVQYRTLKKLDSYNINVAQFIRDHCFY